MHAYSAAAMLLPHVAVTACATATSTRYHRQTEDLQRTAAATPAADAGDQLFEGAAFLDRAAEFALRGSRLLPLPDDYAPARVTMQVSFHYNDYPPPQGS